MNNRPGGLTLDTIARQDARRAAAKATSKNRNRRRHGNKGSRQWGAVVVNGTKWSQQ